MKQLTFLSKIFLLVLAISFYSSCEETPTGPTLPPVIELQTGTDLVTSTATIDAGATFQVRVLAERGDNDMTSFTVLEDGFAIDASRINYVGIGQLENPYSMTSGDNPTFDTNIEITAHDSGDKTYSFRVTDSAGETDEASVVISIVSTPLSIAFESANGGVVSDLTLDAQTDNLKFQIIATKAGSPLSTLEVWEDGVAVDVSRIDYNVIDDFATSGTLPANPLDLIDDEKNGINWFLWVDTHASGANTYVFKITDEAGASEEISVVITVNPITELTGKLLANADGMGNGGMNLLTGVSTAAASSEAHIRDQGIDLAQPATTNWKQQIAPVNGASMRTPAVDFPGFDSTNSASAIEAAFNSGSPVTETGVLIINDEFLVLLATGEYVLVKVANITATPNNNDDEYDLSIKY